MGSRRFKSRRIAAIAACLVLLTLPLLLERQRAARAPVRTLVDSPDTPNTNVRNGPSAVQSASGADTRTPTLTAVHEERGSHLVLNALSGRHPASVANVKDPETTPRSPSDGRASTSGTLESRAEAAGPAPLLAPPFPATTAAADRRSTIPTSVLSQRIGARLLPPDNPTEEPGHPRLLRRHPLAALASEPQDDTLELLATNHSPARTPALPVRTVTVVHPVSLGVMAANVLYSPAPEYPPEAAAARVQGDVRVQAEVDKQGNVAAARVVSGPALLREAAIDAVQRWRYRPYLAQGKAVSMSATAVLEFELQ